MNKQHPSNKSLLTHPAAGVDTLAAAMAANQPLRLAPGVAGLGAQTLSADRDNWRFLRRKQV